MAARAGTQRGQAVIALVITVPEAAILSRFGVLTIWSPAYPWRR